MRLSNTCICVNRQLFWRPETYPKNCHYQKSVDEIPRYCIVWFPFTLKPLSQNVSKDLVYFVAVSRSEIVKYLRNKEALIVLCSVVKRTGGGYKEHESSPMFLPTF